MYTTATLATSAAAVGLLYVWNRRRNLLSIESMAARWKRDLLENVVPFWERFSVDEAHGGFFTALDADGARLDSTKYSWLQCRAVYMWAKLHNDFRAENPEAADRWFELARAGAAFLEKFKDARGRLLFAISRDGSTSVHYQRKPFGAMFYCLACIEYSQCLLQRGDNLTEAESWKAEAIRYFELFSKWLDKPEDLGALPHPSDHAEHSNLACVMCLASLSEAMLVAFPEQRERWMQHVADSQSRVVRHYDPERNIFRENANAARGVEDHTTGGRLFNPGHSIEVAWFLLHLCNLREDASLRVMALDVLEHSLALGWDWKHGGLFYMIDVCGKPLVDCTVTAENKLWWPMTEALYALMLAIELTGGEEARAAVHASHEADPNPLQTAVPRPGTAACGG